MNTADLASTPIRRVWAAWPETAPHTFMWDRDDPKANDLTEVLPFEEYTVTADADCRIDRNRLEAGTHQVVWNVTLGEQLNYNWWTFARDRLKALGLWPLLKACGAQEIRVVKQFPPEVNAPANTLATVFGAQQAILLLDQVWFPAWAFPATLVHESYHLHCMNKGLWDGQKKNELSAYVVTDIYSLLAGLDVNIWEDAVGWPYANYLKGQSWD